MNLVTPSDLSDLLTIENKPLWVAKSDLDNFYHRLQLPSWLKTYFGIPPIVQHGQKVWPVYRVVPMGWSHVVYIAQEIHTHLVSSIGSLKGDLRIQQGSDPVVRDFRQIQYIDDYGPLETSEDVAHSNLQKVISVCQKSELPIKEKKLEKPTTKATIFLGIEVDGQGNLRPATDKFRILLAETRRLIGQRP